MAWTFLGFLLRGPWLCTGEHFSSPVRFQLLCSLWRNTDNHSPSEQADQRPLEMRQYSVREEKGNTVKLLRKTVLVLGPSDKSAMHKSWLEAFNSQTNKLVLTRPDAICRSWNNSRYTGYDSLNSKQWMGSTFRVTDDLVTTRKLCYLSWGKCLRASEVKRNSGMYLLWLTGILQDNSNFPITFL